MGQQRMTSAISSSNVVDPAKKDQFTQLRSLPGYVLPKEQNSMTTPMASVPQMTIPPTTASRYQNRERLYYETDAQITQSKTSNNPRPVMDRLADDAPPASSLYEIGALTPERKYLGPKEEPIVDAKATASPLGSMGIGGTPIASEGNWVTVFGFVGSQANSALDYFRKLGVVERHEMGQGNWIHLKYSTLWAAQKALSKNGSILTNVSSCMIGVIPTQRAMDQVSRASDSFMSPLKKESINRRSDDATQHDIFLKSSVMTTRPTEPPELVDTTAMGPSIDRSVSDNQQSMISQALGYIFGW